MRVRWILVLVLTMGAACYDGIAPIACTEELRFGIQVEVTDSVTGRAAAEGATLTIVEGTYEEIVTQSWDGGRFMFAAAERPGRYDVAVTKDGYAVWVRTGVEVDADVCHVITVTLEARLRPVP